MAAMQTLVLALLVSCGFAQNTTTESPTTESPTTNNQTTNNPTQNTTNTPGATTRAPTTAPVGPTQPQYQPGTYKLNDANGSVCAEVTMAALFAISYMNTDNDVAQANIVLPGENDVTVSGTCADETSEVKSSNIMLSWSGNNFILELSFEGSTEAPTTMAPTTEAPAPTNGTMPTTNGTTEAPTTQATAAPSTGASTTGASTTGASTTGASTTGASTTGASTSATPSASSASRRRKLLSMVGDEGENRLSSITLSYSTGDPAFRNPSEVVTITVFTNKTESFTFEDGTLYKCNSEQKVSLSGESSEGVEMSIKDTQFSPFEAPPENPKVFECDADKTSGLSKKTKIIIGVCASAGGLLVLILLIVILVRCCKRSGYKSV